MEAEVSKPDQWLIKNDIMIIYKNSIGCPDGVWYTTQPPTELNCNPMGEFLSLRCGAFKQDSGYGNVTWYWTSCVNDAGVNGTAIEPGDTSDAYHQHYSNAHSFHSLPSH